MVSDDQSHPSDRHPGGNIALAALTTTGEVQVTTTGGAITDSGDTNTDITAATAALRSVNGIGSGDALETAIGTLAADNSTLGNIEVDPESYSVYVDGKRITVKPAKTLPLSQLFFLR